MDRVKVRKTYKLYINGAFVRSERGRYLTQVDQRDESSVNYAWASRKDLRDAVVAARAAFGGWAGRSAFNRSQILYRSAEMLEDRRQVFIDHLTSFAGYSKRIAGHEVDAAVDRIMYYAGWADKYGQILSSVNPIAAPYFNFSIPEPTGVVVSLASTTSPLVGLLSAIMPVVLSGNTCIVVVENEAPIVAIDFAEVLETSDFPAGVVNVLTGKRDELLSHAASHMDVNAVSMFGGSEDEVATLQRLASENVKRAVALDDPSAASWRDPKQQSLYQITPFVEIKTAWHPIGV
jgi:acyl-CoA reductase-like NAD-dependent aldehyde dehydrogenase